MIDPTEAASRPPANELTKNVVDALGPTLGLRRNLACSCVACDVGKVDSSDRALTGAFGKRAGNPHELRITGILGSS